MRAGLPAATAAALLALLLLLVVGAAGSGAPPRCRGIVEQDDAPCSKLGTPGACMADQACYYVGACERAPGGSAADGSCPSLSSDLECAAADGCQWLPGPSLAELRQLGPAIREMSAEQFGAPNVVVSDEDVTARAGAAQAGSRSGHHRSLRRLVASGSPNCVDNSSSLVPAAPTSVPTALPGSPWSVSLAGVFSNGNTANLSAVEVSVHPNSTSSMTSWIQGNLTHLHGSVPAGLGRVGKSAIVQVKGTDGCGRDAVVVVTVSVNTPPRRSGILNEVVVDTSSSLTFVPLALAAVFEDADSDSLTFTLQQAQGGLNGTLASPPSYAALNDGPSALGGLPSLAADRAYNLSVWPGAQSPGTTVHLAVLASDGTSPVQAEARFSVHFVTHCKVTNFTLWSNCSKLCDSGTQSRNRTVTAPPVGSRALTCPALREERACNTDPCATAPRVRMAITLQGLNKTVADSSGLNESLARTVSQLAQVQRELVTVTLVDRGQVALAASGSTSSSSSGAGSGGGGGRRLSETPGASGSGHHGHGRRLAGVGATAPGAAFPTFVSVVEALVSILVPSSAGQGAQAVAQALDMASRSGVLSSSVQAALTAAGVGGGVTIQIAQVSLSSQRVVANAAPLPRSRVVVVPATGSVIAVGGSDADGDATDAFLIAQPPASAGGVSQLSTVFSLHGYPPEAGQGIVGAAPENAVQITGSGKRIVFQPDASAPEPIGSYGYMTHVLNDGTQLSVPGLTWLVPPHRRLLAEEFFLNASGWTVTTNSEREAAKEGGGIRFEPFADGELDRYVMGIEASINSEKDGTDRTQWKFEAPSTFSGNLAGAYGGVLSFVLGVFEGSFNQPDTLDVSTPLVEMDCATCGGLSGVRLGHYASVEDIIPVGAVPTEVKIPLIPNAWKKKPAAINEAWQPITECDLVSVLSGLTGFRIRGDLTKDHEAVGLDQVALVAPSSSDTSSLTPAHAAIARRTADEGLPLNCRFALTGDVRSGGTNAIAISIA